MSRSPFIEAIHEARYDFETCARHERAACQGRLHEQLSRALDRAGSKVTSEQLLDALFDDYREFKRQKKRAEWARLPRGK